MKYCHYRVGEQVRDVKMWHQGSLWWTVLPFIIMVIHEIKWHKTTHTQMNSCQNWWNPNKLCDLYHQFTVFDILLYLWEDVTIWGNWVNIECISLPVHFLKLSVNYNYFKIEKEVSVSSFSGAAVSSSDPASIVAYPQTVPYSFFPLSLSFFVCKSGTGLNCWGPLKV